MAAGYPPFFADQPIQIYEKIVAGKVCCLMWLLFWAILGPLFCLFKPLSVIVPLCDTFSTILSYFMLLFCHFWTTLWHFFYYFEQLYYHFSAILSHFVTLFLLFWATLLPLFCHFKPLYHVTLFEPFCDTLLQVRYPAHFTADLKDLLRNLLQTDLTKRYGNLKNGVNDIKGHKWYSSTDWISIYQRQVNTNKQTNKQVFSLTAYATSTINGLLSITTTRIFGMYSVYCRNYTILSLSRWRHLFYPKPI